MADLKATGSGDALIEAFQVLARAHTHMVEDFEFRHSVGVQAKTGVLRDVKRRLLHFRRTLQRVAYPGSAPIQLGFSDLREWQVHGDPCKGSKKKHLAAMLGQSCSCGHVAFRKRASGLGYTVPACEWSSLLVHDCKNKSLQRFFSGSLLFHGTGLLTTEVIDNPGHTTGAARPQTPPPFVDRPR